MIFCVEDDDGIRDLVTYTLNAMGLEAKGFPDGKTFWEAMKTTTPDLVMLDIMLPGEDGISLLKRLRSHPATASLPVILETAKGTEYDKVTGLDMGADDYLVKPFGMMEMISRVRAVLRRCHAADTTDRLCVGGLELNTGGHTVKAGGKPVQLTNKEYDLLHLFLSQPSRVYSREQLLCAVWGNDYVGESRTVDVHIATLRTKLGEYGDCIETVRGVGYRLNDRT